MKIPTETEAARLAKARDQEKFARHRTSSREWRPVIGSWVVAQGFFHADPSVALELQLGWASQVHSVALSPLCPACCPTVATGPNNHFGTLFDQE